MQVVEKPEILQSNRLLDKEEALKRLKIEKLFNQILFHTEKSLKFCVFDNYEDLRGESNG
jgi:hypothetical protein